MLVAPAFRGLVLEMFLLLCVGLALNALASRASILDGDCVLSDLKWRAVAGRGGARIIVSDGETVRGFWVSWGLIESMRRGARVSSSGDSRIWSNSSIGESRIEEARMCFGRDSMALGGDM